jgi:hypothetical protein
MSVPFTVEQFFDVFARYNLAIWPLQVVAYALGLAAVALALRPTPWSGRLIAAVLAALWPWMGVVYHGLYFSAINPVAPIFGAFFVAQAALVAWLGVARPHLSFRPRRDLAGWVGGLIILYAAVGYPLLGLALGHQYPRAPLFGVAPCPTTIFTFGLLLWATGRGSRALLVIPLLWAVVATSAALALEVSEDFGLPVAGLAATALLLLPRDYVQDVLSIVGRRLHLHGRRAQPA